VIVEAVAVLKAKAATNESSGSQLKLRWQALSGLSEI
jgi:hypothetical protein